eukprot:TRINITY_DN49478_c0_g1_i1.p1 TRINITY_DN49478_c0_g1~~TRINITY_DN49478_c0_g1_i1.p1  ORF type:complete len:166 (+),score=23.13 TRINITY_DN49478_c0_g1_i1:600-1097(+)
MASTSSLEKLAKVLDGNEALKDEIRKALRIGIQKDTEVLTSQFGRVLHPGSPGEQIVTQAYCSAISVSYSRCTSAHWAPLACLVLDSLYEATMYAAVENAMRNPSLPGSRKVFLTAVGGGVFGNEMSWIHNAMKRAFDKFADFPLEVKLVSYGHSTPEFARLSTK